MAPAASGLRSEPAGALVLAILLAPPLIPTTAKLPNPFGGDESSVGVGPAVECGSGLKLQAAAGVPSGSHHNYRFQGICKLFNVTQKSSGKTYDHVGDVCAVVLVWWKEDSGDLTEKLQVEGERQGHSVKGTIQMVLKCTQDPVLSKPACVRGQYTNSSGWAGLDRAFLAAKPIVGKTTEQEAEPLSKQQVADQPASPSPPPPHKQPAGLKAAKHDQPRTPVGLRQAGPVAGTATRAAAAATDARQADAQR